MNQRQNDMLLRRLIASNERLRRSVERCVATIQQLSVSLEPLALLVGEQETEQPLSSNPRGEVVLVGGDDFTTPLFQDQPIILTDDDGVTFVIETVHGVKDTIRVPRTKRTP